MLVKVVVVISLSYIRDPNKEAEDGAGVDVVRREV